MAVDSCSVPSATCCLVLNPGYNPIPPRIGYRNTTCNTLYPDVTNIITPEQHELIKQLPIMYRIEIVKKLLYIPSIPVGNIQE
jgi:hypothetical protein